MLFNSYTFILLFAPLAILGYFAAGKLGGRRHAMVWLLAVSLAFYGWWNPSYVWLLLASIGFNFGAGILLGQENRSSVTRRAILIVGVAANLGLIAYYKYATFLVGTAAALLDTSWQVGAIVLPLAISFFTFQQIAYLVDAYRGLTRDHDFLDYCVFVTFFPQLIAGPIVHHGEIIPQFRDPGVLRPKIEDISVGVSYFVVGLFKKVVLADGVALFATQVFGFASNGGQPTFVEAWIGALAYTLQLYFDFSGYSDMAIGLGRIFGVRLPTNFDSPYKATNIAEFWRRWHITLSRFLRDYLYIPLGGNRRGRARRTINLMATMLLGGLWHGAGWTFVVWGGLHGLYLVLHQFFSGWNRRSFGLPPSAGRFLGWATTMFAVIIAWVFFRAESFDVAARMLRGMFGLEGITADSAVGRKLPIVWITVLGFVAVAMPNTAQIFARQGASDVRRALPQTRFYWRPSATSALFVAVLAVVSVLRIDRASEFLYFQF